MYFVILLSLKIIFKCIFQFSLYYSHYLFRKKRIFDNEFIIRKFDKHLRILKGRTKAYNEKANKKKKKNFGESFNEEAKKREKSKLIIEKNLIFRKKKMASSARKNGK